MRSAYPTRRFGVATPYDPAGGSDSPPAATIDLPEVTVRAQAPTTPQPSAVALTTRGAPTLYGNWTPALFMPYPRSIGGIVAQVTIEESATDDLTITEHPVEQGAPIADHAFKRPSNVTIRAGWSVAGAYDLSAETGIYGLLLSWQASLLPFDVVTGKRKYTSMLMERLTVTTDEKSEYALMADITCRQIIIVGTQSTSVQTTSESAGDHKEPEKTAPKKENGDQQPRQLSGNSYDPLTGNPPHESSTTSYDPMTGNPIEPSSYDPLTGNPNPEGAKVGQTIVQNTTPPQIEEKGFRAVSQETKDILAEHQSVGQSVGANAAHQKLVRGVAWQRTVRYQHNRGVRSRSVFPY